jgi:hypothetical protein
MNTTGINLWIPQPNSETVFTSEKTNMFVRFTVWCCLFALCFSAPVAVSTLSLTLLSLSDDPILSLSVFAHPLLFPDYNDFRQVLIDPQAIDPITYLPLRVARETYSHHLLPAVFPFWHESEK